jgi:hypothetical protein
VTRLGPTSQKIVVAGAILALVPWLLLLRLETQTQYRGTQQTEDIFYSPSVRALPVLSLGYRRGLAALFWVEALVYFGEQVAMRGKTRYLRDRADAILALDPEFRDVYEWFAVVIVYNSTEITRRDIEISNEFLERGIREFPRDGELIYLLAFNYAIELPSFSQDDQEKNVFRRKAAELFARAATCPGAPPDAALMAVEMGSRGGGDVMAIAYLHKVLALTTDDRIRDQLVARLASLTTRAEADRLDADRQTFLTTWKRDYPYLPGGVFELVGERRGARAAVPADED